MWTSIKEWWKSLFAPKPHDTPTKKTKFFNPVLIIVMIVNACMFMVGHVMTLAAIAGIAAVLSFFLILLGMSEQGQDKTIGFLAKYGLLIDFIVTVVATVLGFQISVTMGLTAMCIGFNLSAFFSVCRWYHGRKQPNLYVQNAA
jgi:hypothetical protein